MILRKFAAAPILLALLAGGCAHKKGGELDESGGISVVRTACPTVGLPAGTGDITLFNPVTSKDASAIDVVANMTNVRSTCQDSGEGNDIATVVTFDVQARRNDASGARDVVLPYFITVVRGGNAVTAKSIGNVGVHFNAGQYRAQTSGQATAYVDRATATLPQDVRERLTRRRRAGEEDAAVDPLTDPQVRRSVLSASFEALVGFQLTDDQLKYNVTR